jgi:hypothetical protein
MDAPRAHRWSRDGVVVKDETGFAMRVHAMLNGGRQVGGHQSEPCTFGLLTQRHTGVEPREAGHWELRRDREGTSAQVVRFETDATGALVVPGDIRQVDGGWLFPSEELAPDLGFVASLRRGQRSEGQGLLPVDPVTMRTVARSPEAAKAWLEVRSTLGGFSVDRTVRIGETTSQYEARVAEGQRWIERVGEVERAAARKRALSTLKGLTPRHGGPWTATEMPFAP